MDTFIKRIAKKRKEVSKLKVVDSKLFSFHFHFYFILRTRIRVIRLHYHISVTWLHVMRYIEEHRRFWKDDIIQYVQYMAV